VPAPDVVLRFDPGPGPVAHGRIAELHLVTDRAKFRYPGRAAPARRWPESVRSRAAPLPVHRPYWFSRRSQNLVRNPFKHDHYIPFRTAN
jgi:hypothetical protein